MEKAKMALGDLPTVRHERYPLHHELVIKLSVTVLNLLEAVADGVQES